MATFTYNDSGAGDCWGNTGGDFDNTDTNLYIGGFAGGTLNNVTTWIPFTVADLPKNTVITSATLRFVSTITRTNDVLMRLGCEAADNPSAPTNNGDLLGRTQTSAFTDDTITGWVTGTPFELDVTSAVQEILNRAGWAVGNTMAILIKDNGTELDNRGRIASYENVTYDKPQLIIVVNSFIPMILDIT